MRTAGQPRFGRVSIRVGRMHKLPATGGVSAFARVLGVTPGAVRHWILFNGLPATRLKRGFLIRKGQFVSWAEETGRYRKVRL